MIRSAFIYYSRHISLVCLHHSRSVVWFSTLKISKVNSIKFSLNHVEEKIFKYHIFFLLFVCFTIVQLDIEMVILRFLIIILKAIILMLDFSINMNYWWGTWFQNVFLNYDFPSNLRLYKIRSVYSINICVKNHLNRIFFLLL